jgi:hypothetical protein
MSDHGNFGPMFDPSMFETPGHDPFDLTNDMSEEERLHREREAAQLEREASKKGQLGTAKLCPGLKGPNGISPGCVRPRETGGTYCTPCRRVYQNTKRQRRVLLTTGKPVRIYKPGVRGEPCHACGLTKSPDKIGYVDEDRSTPICSSCNEAFTLIIDKFGPERTLAAARFLLARGDIYGLDEADAFRKEVIRRLKAKWFQENQDFLIETRVLLPLDHPERLKEVDPKDFKYTDKEYNAMAATVSNEEALAQDNKDN